MMMTATNALSAPCRRDHVTGFLPAIRAHVHDPYPQVTSSLPVPLLGDTEYCKLLDEKLKLLAPDGFESRRATHTLADSIPNAPGIYLFVWSPSFYLRSAAARTPDLSFDTVIYVGKAGSEDSKGTLKSRYKSEYSRYVGQDADRLWQESVDKRTELLTKWLNLEPLYLWYAVIEDRSSINKVERDLINLLNPMINRSGRSSLVTRATSPAF